MSEGRGKRTLAATLLALACLLGGAANADAAKVKFIFKKARVVGDGFVTPGQLETISVSRLAPKAPIKVFIEPPPITLQCGELYFCDPAPTEPAPGTPPYRSSPKGKATLTFVMPSNYYIETDPFNPKNRQPVYWMNGQPVHIDVEAHRRTKRKKIESFGFLRAAVQLQPSPNS